MIPSQDMKKDDTVKDSKKPSWVKYERTYSNSLWYTGYKQLGDGKWIVSYLDDASRFITGYGIFEEVTAQHAIDVLHEATSKHGSPASIMTDHGEPFYANEKKSAKYGVSVFEKELVRLGIKQVLTGGRNSQTNGKIGRFYGELQKKLRLFRNIDDFYDWYNTIRPHMSLDFDNLETPVQAFARKMPQKKIDKQDSSDIL